MVRFPFRIACVAILASVPARAHTWVVDDNGGPGVDFTEIADAVAASSPWDVIVVRPGNYQGFALTIPLTIAGDSRTTVHTGPVTVQAVPTGARAVLAGLHASQLAVRQCRGPIVLMSLSADDTVHVDHCADVRLHEIAVQPIPEGPPRPALWVEAATADVTACQLEGSWGPDNQELDWDGGDGLLVTGGSHVWVADGISRGGHGANPNRPVMVAGSGGDGVHAQGGSRVWLSNSLARGGAPGWNWYYDYCTWDGEGGIGAVAEPGSRIDWSGVRPFSPGTLWGLYCDYTPAPPAIGDVFESRPRDVILRRVSYDPSTSTVGVSLLRGTPGDQTRVFLGRDLERTGTLDALGQRLTERSLDVGQGVYPPSGSLDLTFSLPSSLPPYTLLVVQAEVTHAADGIPRYTNAVYLLTERH